MPEPRRVRSSLGQEPPLDALDVRDVVRAVYDEDEIGEKTKRKKKIQFPGAVSLASTCIYLLRQRLCRANESCERVPSHSREFNDVKFSIETHFF